MQDIYNGFLTISDELTIFPGFSFEQFKHTRFYKNQDEVRIIYLDEQQIIDNRKYIVSLFFKNEKIYMVSLICCDKEFSEKDAVKRKELHDDILKELGINQKKEYSWGKISSDYDARSNVSSIDIIYSNFTHRF
ncbi:MAG: hypothetical protein K2N01_07800 [Lachnospiraceae bacterium]|nr:hypothetical protein [Lachnospiraceae bacterium]